MGDQQPLVLVVGATGTTGRSVADAILATGVFRIAALVRPSSLSKPAVSELQACGVEIRSGDLKDGVESLKKSLEGVEILIITVVHPAIGDQAAIIHAAKEVGVKRVVPSDFGMPGRMGVRTLHDMKLGIRVLIKELGVPHTFVDIGWWMQFYLPIPLSSKAPQVVKEMSWKIYQDGNARNLVTSNEKIGKYVARIIADPRTLNQAVIVWEDEVNLEQAHALGEKLSGDGDPLKTMRIVTTKDDYISAAAAAREMLLKNPTNDMAHVARSWNEYQISMNVLGENTLENAKKLGYLDARELYPDITPLSFEQYAKQFYSMQDPGSVFHREK